MAQPHLQNKIKVHYTCRLDDGSICDSTRLEEPMELKIGRGEILPEIEKLLLDMKPGESTTITLEPEKAYGTHQPELVAEIDRSEFQERGIQPKIGLGLEIKQPLGNVLQARVTEFDDTKVRLDANHPLAGKTLHYDVQLVSVIM